MNYLLLFLTLLWPMSACQEEGTVLERELGTVTKVGDFGYALVPDSDPGTRYAPNELEDAYEVDGLRVIFSGVVGAVPSSGERGGRVWATPLTLTHIEKAKTH